MPIARFQMPDGKIARFEVPEGTTPEQAQSMIAAELPKIDIGSGISKSQSFIEGAAEGASLGFGDEIMGTLAGAVKYPVKWAAQYNGNDDLVKKLDGMGYGDIYTAVRDKRRNEIKAAQDANPLTFMGGNIVGGAAVPMGGGVNTLWNSGKFGKAIVGGGMGALYGAGTSNAENIGDVGVDAARSGAMGAVAAPVLAGAGNWLGSAVGRGGDKIANMGIDTFNTAKNLISQGGRKIGVEVSGGAMTPDEISQGLSSLGDEAVAYFKQASKAGLADEQAYLAAKAQTEGVNLTRGALKQDPELQRLEDMAQQKLLGEDAYQAANSRTESNTAAFADWRDAVANRIVAGDNSGYSPLPLKNLNETDVGNIVGSAVKQRAADLKAPAQEAYDIGATTQSRVNIADVRPFAKEMAQQLHDEGFLIHKMPLVRDSLATLEKAVTSADAKTAKMVKGGATLAGENSGTVPYRSLELYKKQLARAYGMAGNDAEREAMRRINDAFRSKLDNIIENDLLVNPDGAAKQLRQAPNLWREYKQTIFGKDGKAALGTIVDRELTDKQVANLFGASVIGAPNTQKVVQQLKGALGQDHEAIGALRGMFFSRIVDGGLGEQANKIASKDYGMKVYNNIRQFQTKNKALYDELYTPEMQREINDFAKAIYLNAQKNRSKVNPSGSGVYQMAAQNALVKFTRRFGTLGGAAADVIQGLAHDSSVARDANIAIQSITQPLKNIGADSRIISDALRSAGGAAGRASGAQLGKAYVHPLKDVPEFRVEQQFAPPEQPSEQQPLPPQSNAASDMAIYLNKVAMVESSGNPNAKARTSSASGVFQFTDGTWRDMVRKYGSQYGITESMKNDPQAQQLMAAHLTIDNAQALARKTGRQPSEGDLYLAHFAGASGAAKLLSNPNKSAAALLPKAAKANPTIFYAKNGTPRTGAQLAQLMQQKIQQDFTSKYRKA